MEQENDKDKTSYTPIPNALLVDKALTDSELRYYAIIVSLSYARGYCFMSNRQLGERLGKSIRTMQRIIDGLKEKGYVQVREYTDDEGHIHREITPLARVKSVMGHVRFDTGNDKDDMGAMSPLSRPPCQIWQQSNNKKSNNKMSIICSSSNLNTPTSSQKDKGKNEEITETKSPAHCSKRSRKKKEFIPPSLDEVEQYVEEKGLVIDAKYFFDFYAAGEWHDSSGKPVKNWKQKALTWDRREQKERKSKPPVREPVNITAEAVDRKNRESAAQLEANQADALRRMKQEGRI